MLSPTAGSGSPSVIGLSLPAQAGRAAPAGTTDTLGRRDEVNAMDAGDVEPRDGARDPLRPLCVRLDGALLKTDLFYESLVRLIARQPITLLRVPWWLLKGGRRAAGIAASRCLVPPETLPYDPDVLAWVRHMHTIGRRIVLVSESERAFVEPVAAHLGIVSDVVVPQDGAGGTRTPVAAALSDRFGAGRFDYVGRGRREADAWRSAREAYAVVSGNAVPRPSRAQSFAGVIRTARRPAGTALRSLRAHQWVKNLLVFLPLLAAHRWNETAPALAALVAFWSFSLVASSVYVMNDLADLDADRAHPDKRHRPFAGGAVPLQWGGIMVILLLGLGTIAALVLPRGFPLVLGAYFVITCAYTLRLKQVPVLDVLVLALLYAARVMAGSVATAISASAWLLAFSLFFFFGLACVKRSCELVTMRDRGITSAAGRGYRSEDLTVVSMLGTASSVVSVLVLALYINGREVADQYAMPAALWGLCPAILYWNSRVWLLAHRGELHVDPVVFALKDRQSYVVAILAAAVLWVAR
jgi:4-hydroxybenzoate polyprenyltransferase